MILDVFSIVVIIYSGTLIVCVNDEGWLSHLVEGPLELGKYKTLVAGQLKQAYLSSGTIFVALICYPVFLDEGWLSHVVEGLLDLADIKFWWLGRISQLWT